MLGSSKYFSLISNRYWYCFIEVHIPGGPEFGKGNPHICIAIRFSISTSESSREVKHGLKVLKVSFFCKNSVMKPFDNSMEVF